MGKYQNLRPLSNEVFMKVNANKMTLTLRIEIALYFILGRSFFLSDRGRLEEEYDG